MRKNYTAYLLICMGLLLACGPKVLRETVHTSDQTRVELQQIEKDRKTAPYSHPATIADVRLAHVLSSLHHRDSKGRQRPTIRSQHIYELAEALAAAFAKASPKQEVAGVAFPTDRRLLIMSTRRVTSFRAFVRGSHLVIEFLAIEDTFESANPRKKEYTIPIDPPSWEPGFTLIAGKAQRVKGERTVIVDWRDPHYARPWSLRVEGGKVQRRTILMDSLPEEEDGGGAGDPSAQPGSSEDADAQIRALDELDAARRSGLITEEEFERRRRLILEGRMEDAGYDSAP